MRVLEPGCYGGRTVLVTGAGSGIGRAATLRLADLGATVIGVGRRLEPLQETAALAPETRVQVEALDIRNRGQAQELVAALPELHLLVNNAGGQFIARARDISSRGFGSVLDLNLTATAALIHAARPALAAARGRVVSLSLSAPERGTVGLVHSMTARAAIAGLTETLAREWRGEGVRLFCLAPGAVKTAGMADEVAAETLSRGVERSLLGRDTDVVEVAEWVAALGIGTLDVFNGTSFEIDGGAGLVDATSELLPRE